MPDRNPLSQPDNDELVSEHVGHVEQVEEHHDAGGRPRQRFWNRFGGDGFLISLGLHIILGIIGAYVIYQKYSAPEAEVEDFTTGAGGGSGGANAKMFEQRIKPKNPRNLVKSQNKLAVKGGKASVALPDMPQMQMSALESGALSGGASKGFGGGSGGGDGTGMGLGKGGGKNMVSIFGMKGFNAGGMRGYIYDLKQTHDRQPNDLKKGYESKSEKFLDIDAAQGWGFNKVLNTFFRANWNTGILEQYFRSPDPLTLSQIYIPPMDAATAPKEFEVDHLMKSSLWAIHYKGSVIAPKSGKIRFLGYADDILVVRFNEKNVLDSGYSNPSIGVKFGHGRQAKSTDRIYGSNDEWSPKKEKIPVPLRCGPWINVEKGKTYPMEILIAETPGGNFWALLLLEEAAPSTSRPQGEPILFKIGNEPLAKKALDSKFCSEADLTGGDWIWQPGVKKIGR